MARDERREEGHRTVEQAAEAEIDRLNTQEDNLIDLAAEGGLAVDKVRQRLVAVQRKRDQITERLGESDERLQIGVRLIEKALRLLADPQRLYRQMSQEQRHLMNQAIFEKLYVHQDQVDEAVFRPPFDELLAARNSFQVYYRERPDQALVTGGSRTIRRGVYPHSLGRGF